MQAEERSRVTRMFDEIVAEHALGVRGTSSDKKRRAQRFADRIKPHRRLVIRKLIRCRDSLLPIFNPAIVLATRAGDARVERRCGDSQGARCRRPTAPTKRGCLRHRFDSGGEEFPLGLRLIGLAGLRERRSARKVMPGALHWAIRWWLLQREHV